VVVIKLYWQKSNGNYNKPSIVDFIPENNTGTTFLRSENHFNIRLEALE